VGEDADLVARVQAAYRAALGAFTPSTSGWDTAFGDLKKPIHNALISPELKAATSLLRDPASNTHFWGFDAICKAPEGETEPHELVLKRLNAQEDWTTLYARWLHDALVSCAEAIGALRVFYPETTPGYYYELYGEPANIDELLDKIEAAIGKDLHFPNPYAGELGLASRRGIIGFRSLQAVYQAWRLLQISDGRPDFRVVEIGAGLGRTAFFARQFGLVDYTIIDIPMTNAAQGYFLGRTLGTDQIALFGEESIGKVRILPPQAIERMSETFDLALNVDSLTEMAPEVAHSYWEFARRQCDALLSINHELNPHPVRMLYAGDSTVRYTRYPYWVRRGYVEEYITWKQRLAHTRDRAARMPMQYLLRALAAIRASISS
jgi:hypothetical protein